MKRSDKMADTYYQIGSKGDEVKKLQQQLVDAGYSVGSYGTDGVYGKDTRAAVTAYQKANGLTVDGIAGVQTLGSLNKPVAPVAPVVPPVVTPPPVQPVAPTPTTTTPTATETPVQQTPQYTNPLAKEEQKALADYQAWASQPYVSKWAPQMEAKINQMLYRQFNYDPATDAQLSLATKNMTRQVLETMNSRGILNSTVTENQVQQGIADLMPQYQQIARQNFMDEGNQLMSQIDMLMGADENQYNRYQDEGKKYADVLGVVMDMGDREYKLWSDAYERRYAEQQDAIKLAQDKIETDRQKITDAWDRTSELGYVDNQSSLTLGVSAGTLSKEAREAKQAAADRLAEQKQSLSNQLAQINAQYEKEKKVAALKEANTPELIGTEQQVQNYYELRDIYFGGKGDSQKKYVDNPYAAYQRLMAASKENIAVIGQPLYDKLLKELDSAMKAQKSYGSMGEMKTTDYKTDPDFAKNVAYIVANPTTALNEIMNNSEQLIKDYGIDGYNELIRKATLKE
jgi:peptidoglycan hydrolase-like protein with peptidoglycan-binding domain